MKKNIRDSISPKTLLFFTVLFVLFMPQHALAYLDMYTGSYFLQLLLGGVLGILFAINVYWNKIKKFCNQLFSRKKEPGQHE
ncbi:hypothetical protein ACFL7E_05570 [Thermodesulfobacteriota bacterium]